MPHSIPTAVTMVQLSSGKREEAMVEQMLEAKLEKKKPALHESLRSIFIQPPTPERETPLSPTPIHLPPLSSQSDLASQPPPPTPATLIPLHVLPEVRSPPRRNLAMTADSLQLNLRRGRRPRLFGFTEIPGSNSSSAASSANNSRSNSPERTAASPLGLTNTEPRGSTSTISTSASGPGTSLPRRGPIRAQSETHLPTLSNPASSKPFPHSARFRTTSADDNIPLIRRARDNGLKLDFTGIIPIPAHIDSASTYIRSPYSAKLIRKKSGELVRPALKYGGPLTAGGTPLIERDSPLFPDSSDASQSPDFPSRGYKSLPATPNFPKNVHFDSQLERVKLFNKDHKPQVVSRNGSPTQYTTSEGGEFPFPSTDEEGPSKATPVEEKKLLSIKLPNFPSSPDTYSDLQLESLQLDDADRKLIRGVIVVRNFAFNKWVAVRFTFDWWQTTSEVSAVHKETIRDGAYDRFGFTIKLGDMMSKIEEKTLFMCVRYNSEGRELWDSNNGQNYQVNFEKKAVVVEKAVTAGKGRKAWGGGGIGGQDDARLAGLREKLSRLTAEDDELNGPISPNRSTFLSASKRGVNFGFGGSPNGSPRKGFSSLSADNDPPQGIPNQGLAARYDFGAAFKGTRAASPDTRPVELPAVRTGLLAFDAKEKDNTPTRPERPGMDYYSPRYSPIGLPEPSFGASGLEFFAPPNSKVGMNGIMSDSPARYPSSKVGSPLPVPVPVSARQLPTPLDIPDLTVQGPSPPPPESPIASISAGTLSVSGSPKSPSRPTLGRSQTSPAVITTSLPPSRSPLTVSTASMPRSTLPSSPLSRHATLSSTNSEPDVSRSPSPPTLGTSGSSVTSTENSDSPRSLDQPSSADLNLSRFVASRDQSSTDSIASYSSFIEQFCWGGAPTTSTTPTPSNAYTDIYNSPSIPAPPRRIHSSSSLDEYFAHSSASQSGSGLATPRPLFNQSSKHGGGSTGYFPSVAGPVVKGREAEEIDRGLAAASRATGIDSRTGGGGMGMGIPGNMSPPIIAGM